jgi:hypothetical protein
VLIDQLDQFVVHEAVPLSVHLSLSRMPAFCAGIVTRGRTKPSSSIDEWILRGLINNVGGHFLLLVRCSQGTIFRIDDEDSQ